MEFTYRAKNGRSYSVEIEGNEIRVYDPMGLEVMEDHPIYQQIMDKVEFQKEMDCE